MPLLDDLRRLKSLCEQFAPAEKAALDIIGAAVTATERAKATDWPALVATEIRRISGVVAADMAVTSPAEAAALSAAAETAAQTVEKIAAVEVQDAG